MSRPGDPTGEHESPTPCHPWHDSEDAQEWCRTVGAGEDRRETSDAYECDRLRAALELALPYLEKAQADGMNTAVPVSRVIEIVRAALAGGRDGGGGR